MSDKTTRDTVAKLMAEAGAEEPAEEAEAPPEADGAEGGAEAVEPAEATAGDVEAAPAPARPRGPDGKFAPAAVAVKPATPEVAAPAPAPTVLNPPADWSPKAKAHWDKLPREVQEEGIRLHLETKKTLQDAAQVRQIADGWQRRVAPYEPIFRTAGVDPAQGVQNVLGIYAQLVTGAPDVRQRVAAELIRQFVGIDEASLRAIGMHLEAKPEAPQAVRPDQVQDIVRKSLEQERSQATRTAESEAIRQFEASQPEFLSKVQPEFVELVKVQRGLGKPITKELLQQCYDKSCKMNDETAAILKQRDDAADAEKRKAEALKSRAAASGIKNEPAGPAGGGPRDASTRETVARLMKKPAAGAHL